MRAGTAASRATASMQSRSTTPTGTFGGTVPVFRVHSCPYAPVALTQVWWRERFTCADTTEEQVIQSFNDHLSVICF